MGAGKTAATLSLIAATAALALVPSPAAAYSVKHFGALTDVRVDEPGGCQRTTFFVWSELPGADSYTVNIEDTLGFFGVLTYPPYSAESEAEFGGEPPVPKGQHRIALTYQGGGVGGCQANDLERLTLKSFVANFCEEVPALRRGGSPDKCESQIVGTVTKPDATPVGAAPIKITGPKNVRAQTKSNGAFGAKVKPGRYQVEGPKNTCVVGKSGCKNSTAVKVDTGRTEVVNFVEQDLLSVEGTITDEFGRGVQGVRVGVTGPESKAETTGQDGRYDLDLQQPGTYELTAKGSGRGPYEIYYAKFADGSVSGGTAADVTLGGPNQENSATVDFELDRRLQFKVEVPESRAETALAPTLRADGVSRYPITVRATTQAGDPAPDVQLQIDPDLAAEPRAVICTNTGASRPIWPFGVNPDNSVSLVGLPEADTITDADGAVSFDLFPGTEAGSFSLSGFREPDDFGSIFFHEIPFSPPPGSSYSEPEIRAELNRASGDGEPFFASQAAVLEYLGASRGIPGDPLAGIDAVPVTAGGKAGLAFFKLGSPPAEPSLGTLLPSNQSYVLDNLFLTGLPGGVTGMPTLETWAAGNPISIVRSDPRSFLRWPLPISEGLGGCLQGNSETMTFTSHSPAHLMLTDSEGRKIGFDAKGKRVDGAPGASKSAGGDDFIVVPTGNYKLTLAGTGKGEVELEARSGAAVSVAQFKSAKGEKQTLKVSASALLPKTFRFDGERVKSVDGVPLEVRGLPAKLRDGKAKKVRIRVSDVFGEPVSYPVLNGSGALGSVQVIGDGQGKIVTKLRPTKAGKASLTVTAPGLLPAKQKARVSRGG